MKSGAKSHCGYIAILGRPNVGKSTLLNALLGEKISIVTHKRQTTRHPIYGIKTKGLTQAIFVDTPGIHQHAKERLNQYMNQVAEAAISDVDLILFLVDATHWAAEDQLVLDKIKKAKCPVFLVANKIDELGKKEELFSLLPALSKKMDFLEIFPISAKKKNNIEELERLIFNYLPENPHFFDDKSTTNQRDDFIISEVIREKVFRQVHQEVPYSSTVVIEKTEKEGKLFKIYATILVEKSGQKNIMIGRGGEKIKRIGQLARLDLEKMYRCKVFLQLWVKVKEDWEQEALKQQ